MDVFEGIWNLVDCRAWDATTERVSAPYGARPMGYLGFCRGRMLVVMSRSDAHLKLDDDRGFGSYGGRYTFDGSTLECEVDVASDTQRIGRRQVRGVTILSQDEILFKPPARLYGTKLERHELVWQRVWHPDDTGTDPVSPA